VKIEGTISSEVTITVHQLASSYILKYLNLDIYPSSAYSADIQTL